MNWVEHGFWPFVLIVVVLSILVDHPWCPRCAGNLDKIKFDNNEVKQCKRCGWLE